MSHRSILKTITEITRKHNFFQEKIRFFGEKSTTFYTYGSPGALMRKNVLEEWISWSLKNQENIHYIENPISLSPCNSAVAEPSTSCTQRSSLTNDVLDHFHSHLQEAQSSKGSLPLSVLTAGIVFRGETSDDLLKKSPEKYEMLMGCFPPAGMAAKIFDFSLKQRLSWWRQYSVQSSRFIEAEISSDNNSQVAHIAYSIDGVNENVETITNHGEVDLPDSGGSSLPHLITCQTDLETCMLVFLLDACTETSRNTCTNSSKSGRRFLQFHSRIAPYDIQVLCAGTKMNNLQTIGQDVHQKLKSRGLSILDFRSTSTLNKLFLRNDELGVPYTLIIKDQALDDGLVLLRSRDTGIKEQLHITEVPDRVCRYLQVP